MIPLGLLGGATPRAVAPGGPTDSLFTSVSALLHLNGADASTTFTDATGRTWTATGTARIHTAQSKFGGASLEFPAAGDAIYAADSDDFYFDGDFTIELFYRPTSLTAARRFLCGQGDIGATSISCMIEMDTFGRIRFWADSGKNFTASTVNLTVNVWNHIAVTRLGSLYTVWVNGASAGTYTNATLPSNFAGDFYIGRCGLYTGLTAVYPIDEFRITKGTARYTAPFTPPSAEFPNSAPAFSFADVSALLHMEGADASTTFTDTVGTTWTANGNAQIDTAQARFGSASMLLDGTGDFIRADASALFGMAGGDWTVEGFFRRAAGTNNRVLYDCCQSGTVGFALYASSTSFDGLGYGTNSAIVAGHSTAFTVNTWQHFAVCRQGNTVRGYLDGVQVFSTTDARTLAQTSSAYIGADHTGGAGLNGHLDEFRIVKGRCLYPDGTTFTPASAQFPDS